MAYVDENLLPGERVVYRAHLHRIIYALPVTLAILGVALLALGFYLENAIGLAWVGVVVLIVAFIIAIGAYIKSSASEFAVTNRRVVIKVGVIQRHTVELLLQKVEGIGVDQTVFGRMFNLGSIVVIGTGGTREEFTNIADPLQFRHQVQAQTTGAPEAAATLPLTTGGIYCSACGTQNPPQASFCFKCGQRLATTPVQGA